MFCRKQLHELVFRRSPCWNTVQYSTRIRQPPKPTRFRSKHYDPATATGAQPRKKLEPHVLSARLKGFCDTGQLESAIKMLKSVPLDAQNTAVWNTLMWECMKAKQFQKAYLLCVDMKRRGFRANLRTYQTMLNGLSRIQDWVQHRKQLRNAHAVYEHYQRHLTELESDATSSEETTNAPLIAYFRILGDNGLQQQMFDIYHELPKHGPLAANHILYTAMFQALSTKSKSSPQSLETLVQHAASARLLWSLMLTASKKNNFPMDAFVVASAISVLARGLSADQEFAFQIANKYFGVAFRGLPMTTPLVPMSAPSLGSILSLCNATGRYQDCVDVFQAVMKRVDDVEIIDRAHGEEVLHAHTRLNRDGSAAPSVQLLEWMLRQDITLNGPKLRPNKGTYDLVLKNCALAADWVHCKKTFQLMTGYHCHDFADGSSPNTKPRRDERSAARTIDPDADTVTFVLRAALATRNAANVRQALRISDFIMHTKGKAKAPIISTAKASGKATTFSSKLATLIIEAVEHVFNSPNNSQSIPAEVEHWRNLAEVVGPFTEKRLESDFIPTVYQVKDKSLSKYERVLSYQDNK